MLACISLIRVKTKHVYKECFKLLIFSRLMLHRFYQYFSKIYYLSCHWKRFSMLIKMTVTACIPSLKNIILCLLYLKCLLLNHLTSQVSKQQQIILIKYLFDLATKPIFPQLKSEKLVFTIVNCIYSIIIKICIIMNAYIYVLMDCTV